MKGGSMPNEYTEVKHTGWGQNIVKSILGVLVGIVLFILSFVVLWNSEGRVNIGAVAEQAVAIDPSSLQSSAEGNLVSLTGTMNVTEQTGDPEYLKPGDYVVLHRVVEMYAWVEKTETKTKKKTGGGTEETTTYRYSKEWTAAPEASSNFKIPEGHYNPHMKENPETFFANEVKIGVYTFDHRSADLPENTPISLSTRNAIPDWEIELIGNKYLYRGEGSYDNPVVGDIRISFTAVLAGQKVTLFGKMNGSYIEPYYYKGKDRLYRVLSGTREEAVVRLKTEHKVTGWILRIVGFVLMWIGLTLFFGPISAVLDILPFLGGVSRSLVAVFTFIVALCLSVVTIVVSMIFHNTIALIVLILLVATTFAIYLFRKKKK
jgi:hypothetical protein